MATTLLPVATAAPMAETARYDKLGDAFGAKTYYVTTPSELSAALNEAIALRGPVLIDVQLGAEAFSPEKAPALPEKKPRAMTTNIGTMAYRMMCTINRTIEVWYCSQVGTGSPGLTVG